MTKPKRSQTSPPEVPDDTQNHPAGHRSQTRRMLFICIVIIIVTLALIVTELMS